MKTAFTAPILSVAALTALLSGCSNLDTGRKNEIRLMSYNIFHCEGADKKLDIRRTASVIARENPDFAALQEVDCRTERSKGLDLAGELGTVLGLHATFAEAIPFAGGSYGVAMLSKEKPLSVRRKANTASITSL